MSKFHPVLLLLAMSAAFLRAQPRSDIRFLGDRIVAVVPMIGAGTPQDPRRPLFMPTPEENKAREEARKAEKNQLQFPSRILSWRYELSDDGKFALVEVSATDREALKEIASSARADVKVFEIGKAKQEEIETEFRKYKRTFDASKFAEGRK